MKKPATRKQQIIRRVCWILIALILIDLIAWAGYASDRPSFARGVFIGGGVAIALVVLALVIGRRGPTAIRVFSGQIDERELAIKNQALAHSAVAMLLTAAGCEVGTLYGMPALAVAGSVIAMGVLVGVASFILQTRRG
ncbi:MAG: hypothetical protein JW722_03900 [Demequinaceae bacterium]|nr:hypothetical protein [Demequinaceae bacterium]